MIKQLQGASGSNAIDSRLDIVNGVAHDVEDVRGCVLHWLQPLLQSHSRADR